MLSVLKSVEAAETVERDDATAFDVSADVSWEHGNMGTSIIQPSGSYLFGGHSKQ